MYFWIRIVDSSYLIKGINLFQRIFFFFFLFYFAIFISRREDCDERLEFRIFLEKCDYSVSISIGRYVF